MNFGFGSLMTDIQSSQPLYYDHSKLSRSAESGSIGVWGSVVTHANDEAPATTGSVDKGGALPPLPERAGRNRPTAAQRLAAERSYGQQAKSSVDEKAQNAATTAWLNDAFGGSD